MSPEWTGYTKMFLDVGSSGTMWFVVIWLVTYLLPQVIRQHHEHDRWLITTLLAARKDGLVDGQYQEPAAPDGGNPPAAEQPQ